MTGHDEIRGQLSAYCGGDLTPAERERVEAHLVSCPSCRQELSDLETTLRLVRSQPEVDPPPWMASRIMARVREEAERQKRGWLQRLFLPLRVKLPLEVLAIALVCVVSYVVVRDSGRQLLPPPLPPSASAPAVEEKGAVPQGEGQPAIVPPTPVPGERVPTPPATPAVPPSPAGQGYAPAPAPPMAVPTPPPAAPLREEVAPAARSKEAIGGSPAPAPESAPRRQKAEPEAKKARSLDGGGVPSEADSQLAAPAAPLQTLSVRLTVADPEGAEHAIRRAVASSGGTVTGRHLPRQLTARIPAPRLPALLEQLGRVGRFSERPAVAGLSGPVDVSITW